MFLLLSFLSDTLDVLEEFLDQLRRKKEENFSISNKRKPPKPPNFLDMGL